MPADGEDLVSRRPRDFALPLKPGEQLGRLWRDTGVGSANDPAKALPIGGDGLLIALR